MATKFSRLIMWVLFSASFLAHAKWNPIGHIKAPYLSSREDQNAAALILYECKDGLIHLKRCQGSSNDLKCSPATDLSIGASELTEALNEQRIGALVQLSTLSHQEKEVLGFGYGAPESPKVLEQRVKVLEKSIAKLEEHLKKTPPSAKDYAHFKEALDSMIQTRERFKQQASPDGQAKIQALFTKAMLALKDHIDQNLDDLCASAKTGTIKPGDPRHGFLDALLYAKSAGAAPPEILGSIPPAQAKPAPKIVYIYPQPIPEDTISAADQFGSLSFPESPERYRMVVYDLGETRTISEIGSVHSPRPVALSFFAFDELPTRINKDGKRVFDPEALKNRIPDASAQDDRGLGYIKKPLKKPIQTRYTVLRWEPDFNPPPFVVLAPYLKY